MIELAQLFQDMEAAVVTQEPAIENIEDKTENTVENLNQGNKHLDGAVVKARSARRKKWICFWIVGEYPNAVPRISPKGWMSNASQCSLSLSLRLLLRLRLSKPERLTSSPFSLLHAVPNHNYMA